MSGTFDPDSFLDGASAEGAMDTTFQPCPEGTFHGQIGDKLEVNQFANKKGGTSTIMRLNWEVLDEGVREQLERERVFVRQDVFLDLDENGAISTQKGKNIQLGRIREAVGQNKPGPWNPRNLVGGQAMIHVSHKSRANDPETKDANVDRVAAMS